MKILILDYECGNIGCLKNIFKYLEAEVTVHSIKFFNSINILEYDIVVLPGVGNFQYASEYLNYNLNLNEFKKWLDLGKKIICICLGFQLLFQKSDESNKLSENNPGLGIIAGNIKSLSSSKRLSLNIGWAKSNYFSKSEGDPLLKNILNEHFFYHMHSFGLKYETTKNTNIFKWYTLSRHRYSNIEYISAFQYKQYYGFQFHPEKSGENGLLLLKGIIKNDS